MMPDKVNGLYALLIATYGIAALKMIIHEEEIRTPIIYGIC